MPVQRCFIELSYDGTRYHGWQVQQNAVSVQEVLNKALSTILRQPIETTGCGRTDTGVHAREFFAHFDVQYREEQELNSSSHFRGLGGLNAILPADIAIKSIIPVHETAHARFDATLRSYEYHIHFKKDPFRNGYSWLLRDVPDLELMNQAAVIMMEYIDLAVLVNQIRRLKLIIVKLSRQSGSIKMEGWSFRSLPTVFYATWLEQ